MQSCYYSLGSQHSFSMSNFQNVLEIIMSNDEFVDRWRKVLADLLQNQAKDSDPTTTASINAAKLLYMKRRFVLEQLFSVICTTDINNETHIEIENLFSSVYEQEDNFHVTQELFQTLQKDLLRRISRLQQISCNGDTIGSEFVTGSLFAEVIFRKKRLVASRISKICIEFFVFCCCQLSSAANRIQKLVNDTKDLYYSEQIVTSYRTNISEMLNFYIGLSENLNLKGANLMNTILQSVYTDENTLSLNELR